jgi:hypothetical protein
MTPFSFEKKKKLLALMVTLVEMDLTWTKVKQTSP